MSSLPTVQIEHNGLQLVATLPEVFASLAPILPVATKLFGSRKTQAVNSRDLHKALGVARDHSTWLAGILKQYDLVEGEDFVIEMLDKANPSNWAAIKANGGKVPTVYLFKPKVAAKIASFTKTETGRLIWDYMYAVTDAAHDTIEHYYQKELEGQKRIADDAWKKADILAKGTGTSATVAANYITQINELKAELQRVREASGPEYERIFKNLMEALASFKKDYDKAKTPERIKQITDQLMACYAEYRGGNCEARTYY